MVDLNALRTNQVIIVGTVALAFLLGAERGVVLLALLALCMAIGVAFPAKGRSSYFIETCWFRLDL